VLIAGFSYAGVGIANRLFHDEMYGYGDYSSKPSIFGNLVLFVYGVIALIAFFTRSDFRKIVIFYLLMIVPPVFLLKHEPSFIVFGAYILLFLAFFKKLYELFFDDRPKNFKIPEKKWERVAGGYRRISDQKLFLEKFVTYDNCGWYVVENEDGDILEVFNVNNLIERD